MNRFTFLAAAAAVSALGFVGCDDQKSDPQNTMPPGMGQGGYGETRPASGPPATRDAGDTLDEEMDDAGDALDDAGEDAAEGASDATDAAGDAIRDAADATGDAAEDAGDALDKAADDAADTADDATE